MAAINLLPPLCQPATCHLKISNNMRVKDLGVALWLMMVLLFEAMSAKMRPGIGTELLSNSGSQLIHA